MNIVNINANAKVNLSIDILGQRDDGYHLVNMIMQEIPLYDKIIIFNEDNFTYLKADVIQEILEAKEKQLAHEKSLMEAKQEVIMDEAKAKGVSLQGGWYCPPFELDITLKL